MQVNFIKCINPKVPKLLRGKKRIYSDEKQLSIEHWLPVFNSFQKQIQLHFKNKTKTKNNSIQQFRPQKNSLIALYS